jgi:hypothetical protein
MIFLIIVAVAGLVIAIPAQVQGATLNIRISQNDDDAQQNGDSVYLNRTYLDVGDSQEEIGLRFQVPVPKGSTIDKARIDFYCNENHPETVNINIYGEDVGDAPVFTSGDNHIVTRYNDNATDASTPWPDVPDWTVGNTYSTPSIKDIVQEIIANPDWASGNSMVFFIIGSDDD